MIELVIVLAVLGVLAAIAIPQLTGLRGEAELRGALVNISSEVDESFATDLLERDFNGANGPSGVDWTDGATTICPSLEANKDEFSSAAGYQFAAPAGGGDNGNLAVPLYDAAADEIGESIFCTVSEA